jgi:hypothetical protein
MQSWLDYNVRVPQQQADDQQQQVDDQQQQGDHQQQQADDQQQEADEQQQEADNQQQEADDQQQQADDQQQEADDQQQADELTSSALKSGLHGSKWSKKEYKSDPNKPTYVQFIQNQQARAKLLRLE